LSSEFICLQTKELIKESRKRILKGISIRFAVGKSLDDRTEESRKRILKGISIQFVCDKSLDDRTERKENVLWTFLVRASVEGGRQ
jgi:hypothetical protein